ncbi:MAG: hypothetical protein IPQ04_11750 [Saprospiraceae bacterium]|nr:hypothetical protein [Saprospiraceae bacterium]
MRTAYVLRKSAAMPLMTLNAYCANDGSITKASNKHRTGKNNQYTCKV